MSIQERESKVLFRVYPRSPVSFVSGEGSWLVAEDGTRYLDCLSGISVVSVGHANPRVAEAIARQASTLVHVSNFFCTEPMVELAERLVGLSGLDRVFFANDGATANEAAIKLARKWGQTKRGPECFEVVSLVDSFHGRTLATLAATGQPAKQAVFQPLPSGFSQVPVGDLDALRNAVSSKTAAVLVETVQAEGGVRPVSAEYLQAVRQLCDEREVLMIVDDVQCGMGRTGSWFSWEPLGFEPDVATMAKALANGLPIGAALAKEKVADVFKPGDHGTTFGGGPVVCAAALAVLDEFEEREILKNVEARSNQFKALLSEIEGVTEVRGRGLLLGVGLEDARAVEIARNALTNHLIVNPVRPDTVRFAPPLTISGEEVDEAVRRFSDSI